MTRFSYKKVVVVGQFAVAGTQLSFTFQTGCFAGGKREVFGTDVIIVYVWNFGP